LAFGLWPLAFGLWPLAFGLWPLAFGLWPLAFGLWPLAFGLWPLAFFSEAGFLGAILGIASLAILGIAKKSSLQNLFPPP
jgi:hypothetical protein